MWCKNVSIGSLQAPGKHAASNPLVLASQANMKNSLPYHLRTPADPEPFPVQEPPDPPENPDMPVREPDPEDPGQI